MTDHLDRAHDKLLAVRVATDTDARFDALYQAVCRMWDHLEDAHEVTSAPQTAPQTDAGQGDGDKAERAVAREIWRWYVGPSTTDAFDQDKHAYAYDIEKAVGAAQDALAAAEPHIRAKIAAEIEARQWEVESVHHFGFGENGWACLCGFTSPVNRQRTEHITAELHAARIARGEKP